MKTKIISLLLVLTMVVALLAACGGGDCDHTDADKDHKCDNCTEVMSQCADANKDHKCDTCSKALTSCADANSDGKCDVCGKTLGGTTPPPDDDDTLDVYWEETVTLRFQINQNSNNDEFPEASKRYLAGEGEYADSDSIDVKVRNRNEAAEAAAKVDVTYTYPNSSTGGGFGWGGNIDTIFNDATSDDDAVRPDVFVNYVYDMVATSLRGSLANLYTTRGGQGTNYFSFKDLKDTESEMELDKVDTGEGYMYAYMRSLTLSKTQMYLLASDYFIDIIRAMFVVPVNNAALATITVDTDNTNTANADRTGDKDFTVDDMYQMVRDNEWTYANLAALSELYSVPGPNGYTINDKVGFAVSGSSGLSPAGLVYTTPIVIIDRYYAKVYPEDGPMATGDMALTKAERENWNDFVYEYPSDPSELVEYCTKLEDLFTANGVVVVKDNTPDAVNFTSTGNSLLAIQQAFKQGNVLFGGVVLVGSLEAQVYKDMSKDGTNGVGILPVPMYKAPEYDEETGEYSFTYMTQIHNLARIGGIAFGSKKFDQCSAFLEYQSTHSTEILEEYYTWKMQFDIGGGVQGNMEMLDLVRSNVRSAFDKAMEDAIDKQLGQAGEGDAPIAKWHSLILAGDYKYKDEIATDFNNMIKQKVKYLNNLYLGYGTLPK